MDPHEILNQRERDVRRHKRKRELGEIYIGNSLIPITYEEDSNGTTYYGVNAYIHKGVGAKPFNFAFIAMHLTERRQAFRIVRSNIGMLILASQTALENPLQYFETRIFPGDINITIEPSAQLVSLHGESLIIDAFAGGQTTGADIAAFSYVTGNNKPLTSFRLSDMDRQN
jgi:hypothetical protein